MNKNLKNIKRIISTSIVVLLVFACFISGVVFVDAIVKTRQIYEYNAKISEYEILKTEGNYTNLKEINSSYLGWITCDDANVSLPIVEANMEDEYFYLTHDFEKKESICGVPFQKFGTKLGVTDNVVIIGHSFQNNAFIKQTNVLSDMANYVYGTDKTLNYSIILETENKTYQYKVFSAFKFSTKGPNVKEMNIFETKVFNNFSEFNKFYNLTKSLSVFDSEIEASYGDKFLTIYTCNKNNLDERIIVVAKQIN